MKKTIEEIKESFKSIAGDGITSDEAIAFLEDLEDSYAESAGVNEEEVEKRVAEAVEKVANEWRQKYVDRFFEGGKDAEEEAEKTEEEKEQERAESVQIEDLFEEKKEENK